LAPALAQEFRATLTGRVGDPSDSPIAGAAIIVTNLGTNAINTAKTNSQGNYTVLFLRPGTYSVRVETPGFRIAQRGPLELSVNQTTTLNFRLELGALNQEVTVTTDNLILEQGTADRGGVIDEQSVREYPLNGRNPFMLAMLVPGVDFNGNLTYQRPFDNGAIADWNIGGGGNRNAEFLLDGAPNNSQAGGNNIAYVPPVDSVQEVTLQVNSYDAQ